MEQKGRNIVAKHWVNKVVPKQGWSVHTRPYEFSNQECCEKAMDLHSAWSDLIPIPIDAYKL